MNDRRVIHPNTGEVHWADPTCVKALCQTVVVIDPEDREQARRLVKLFWDAQDPDGGLSDTAYMQAALREYANPKPPKPDEPTGLGAVVWDKDGKAWVRIPDPAMDKPWRDAGVRSHWQAVNAVEVLSEGVQP